MPQWRLLPLLPTSSQCTALFEAGLVVNILLSLSSLLPSLYKVSGATKRGENSANQPASSIVDTCFVVVVVVILSST